MANILPGSGTSLQVKISGTLTTIPQTFDIEWSGMEVAERNPTTLADLNIRKKPGLPNFGEVKGKLYLDPNDSTHKAIREKVYQATPNQAQDEFKLIYADGLTTPANCLFKGFFKTFEQSGIQPSTGNLEMSFTIPVDAITSWTDGV